MLSEIFRIANTRIITIHERKFRINWALKLRFLRIGDLGCSTALGTRPGQENLPRTGEERARAERQRADGIVHPRGALRRSPGINPEKL